MVGHMVAGQADLVVHHIAVEDTVPEVAAHTGWAAALVAAARIAEEAVPAVAARIAEEEAVLATAAAAAESTLAAPEAAAGLGILEVAD